MRSGCRKKKKTETYRAIFHFWQARLGVFMKRLPKNCLTWRGRKRWNAIGKQYRWFGQPPLESRKLAHKHYCPVISPPPVLVSALICTIYAYQRIRVNSCDNIFQDELLEETTFISCGKHQLLEISKRASIRFIIYS